VSNDKPWWKQTPAARPDAARAVRPTEDEDRDDDDEADDNDEVDEQAAGPAALNDLADGETTTMQGSGAQPYILRNVGGVYSCSCPAWRNQGAAIERRTCKHLRAFRGDAAETARVGTSGPAPRAARVSGGTAASAPATSGTAPPILLAHPWDHSTDLTGWWMSEKLDGVRAYWDGARFISRLGNAFAAPDWFADKLPSTPLDGELWAGRKKFQRAVSIARRQDRGDAWRELSYVVFDAPGHQGPFEDRLEHVRAYMEQHRPPHASWHPHERCTGLDHLRGELARVEGLGGEGLMMRQPGSKYEIGRSWTLRKVKTFHDAEARVIGHERGAGKHKGRLGSLQCQMPDGTVFNVGTGLSDAERLNPPPVGAIITYRYQELSNDGVPRFPSYVGVRDDVAWPPTDAPATRPRPAPVPPPVATPASTAAPATASEACRRTFTRGEATWSIELDGRSVKISIEGPGVPAETTTRRNTSAAAAWRDAERLIAEKLRDGFAEA
jgi:DNA ligase-1